MTFVSIVAKRTVWIASSVLSTFIVAAALLVLLVLLFK